MNEDKIISGIASTLTEAPVYEFTVPITEQFRFHKVPVIDWMIKKIKGFKPETERLFKIYPCKVGNIHRVAGKAVELPNELNEGDLSAAVMPLMTPHRQTIVYIIASAIQNNRHEPDPRLMDFINDNFDNLTIQSALQASFDALEMEAFLNSIVLAKGNVRILRPTQTSPEDGSELIASHTP